MVVIALAAIPAGRACRGPSARGARPRSARRIRHRAVRPAIAQPGHQPATGAAAARQDHEEEPCGWHESRGLYIPPIHCIFPKVKRMPFWGESLRGESAARGQNLRNNRQSRRRPPRQGGGRKGEGRGPKPAGHPVNGVACDALIPSNRQARRAAAQPPAPAAPGRLHRPPRQLVPAGRGLAGVRSDVVYRFGASARCGRSEGAIFPWLRRWGRPTQVGEQRSNRRTGWPWVVAHPGLPRAGAACRGGKWGMVRAAKVRMSGRPTLSFRLTLVGYQSCLLLALVTRQFPSAVLPPSARSTLGARPRTSRSSRSSTTWGPTGSCGVRDFRLDLRTP